MKKDIIFPFKLQEEGEKLLEEMIRQKFEELIDSIAVSVNTVPMTPEEVAEYFKVTQPTIDKWVREGMPKHKNGAVVRYYKDEVDAWFKSLGAD